MTKTVLDEIKQALMVANAVQGEQEFCVALRCVAWLGKNASYMRVLRFQQLQPSADALAVCASKLNYYTQRLERSSDSKHKQWAQRFAVLHSKCTTALNEQARTKWQAAERMGAV
jgi:hypothetical protein